MTADRFDTDVPRSMRMSDAIKRWTLVLLAALAPALAGCASTLVFSRPVVLLGEVHDNAAQQALRLEAVEAWLAQGARPALLMEQFNRDRQADIDLLRTQAKPPGAAALIEAGSPGRKGWNWSFYEPFVALALKHDLPIVAANVGRDEARKVMREGLSAAGFDAQVPPDLLQQQTETVLASHCGMIDAKMAARMALMQVARDQFMARQVDAHAARGALLLAGNGHVRTDVGVPRWLSPATRARTQAIGVLERGDDRSDAFDLVIFTPEQQRTDPCAAMQPPAPL